MPLILRVVQNESVDVEERRGLVEVGSVNVGKGLVGLGFDVTSYFCDCDGESNSNASIEVTWRLSPLPPIFAAMQVKSVDVVG